MSNRFQKGGIYNRSSVIRWTTLYRKQNIFDRLEALQVSSHVPREDFVDGDELLFQPLQDLLFFITGLAFLPPRIDSECQQNAGDDSCTFSEKARPT